MKIKFFEVEPWECEELAALESDHEVEFIQERLKRDNASAHADADVVSTFIYSDLERAVLEQLPGLKLIATRSTGHDHVDLDYAAANDVAVCNVPAYGDETVAEHVFALLLAVSHRLIEAVDRTRRGDFTPQGLTGFDLAGRTLGVIGTGRIGRRVISIARGFDMDVIAQDVKPDEKLADELGFRYVPMEELLGEADVVTVHVPGSDKTRHLLAEREFARMKHGAVLINTSRGNVVHVQSLVQALAEGRLSAAGLDVLPEEPVITEEAELLRRVYEKEHDLSTLLADHVLLHMGNVVITPHSAFNTREAVQRILDTTRENIRGFCRGEPRNLVGSA